MTINSSAITVIPKIFSGLRVLLVEPDESSLQHHAYILTQNSYRVTSTTKAFMGMSMIMNGYTYDCVLIDADMCDMDMMAFVQQVLKHQPGLTLIMMASDDIHLKITKETLENEAVMCLLKPCSLKDICNIWKHICRKRIAFQEKRINVDEDGAMCKQVTYEDLFSDDDDDAEEITADQGNINVGTAGSDQKKTDKGKQPLQVLKRKNDQQPAAEDDDDDYYEKRKDVKRRIKWKGALHDKFLDALNALGEQAHSSSILKHMNVPGLTRFQVASHLQKYKLKQKVIKLGSITERGNNYNYNYNLQVERHTNRRRRFGYSSRYDNNVPVAINNTQCTRSALMLNSVGVSYMTIDNIKAKLQGAGALPTQQIPIINNSDQTTNYSLRFNCGGQQHVIGHDTMVPHDLTGHQEALMAPPNSGSSSSSATVSSDYSLQGVDGFDQSWGAAAGTSEPLGIATAPSWSWVTHGPQDLASLPQGGVFPSQNLSQAFSRLMSLSAGVELPMIDSGLPNTDFSLPKFSAEDNINSLVAQIQPPAGNYSIDGTSDYCVDDLFMKMSQSDLEFK